MTSLIFRQVRMDQYEILYCNVQAHKSERGEADWREEAELQNKFH